MAIAFGARVMGGEKLRAKLQSLKKRTATKACRAGVNAGSKIVLKAAKQNLKRRHKMAKLHARFAQKAELSAARRGAVRLKGLTKAERAGALAARRLLRQEAVARLKASQRTSGAVKSAGSTTHRLLTSLGRKVYVKKGTAVAITGPRKGFVDPVTGADPRKIAHFVEKGRKGVTAKGKALRFRAANGLWVFARRVNPAFGSPFMGPALESNRGEIMDASAKATWGVIEKDAKG